MSRFVISEILGLFVNTLTADDRYFFLNFKNLQEPIQVQLSKKKNFFLNFYSTSETYIKFLTF